MADDIARWLDRLGLGDYFALFAESEIDLDVLPELNEHDLKEIGLPIGPRKKLLRAIRARLDGAEARGAVMSAMPSPAACADDDVDLRQLTVLFCDLVGSTALSARLGPEAMRELLRAYHEACAGSIGRFDGYVAKLMGDGVFAYFGYPRAHENDAERAVNAALGIVDAIRALNARRGERPALAVRIGVATGMVAVGDIVGQGASEEAAIVGDAPNLASRLQEIAKPDTVIVSDATRALVGDLFDVEALGEHELKGVPGPVAAWAVLRPRRVESRFEAIHGARLTGLVGRDEEMEILLRRWERAKSGEGQVVLISGEPGLGKSRLVHAFADRCAGEAHLAVRVQCSPLHAASALHPILQQIERRMGLMPEDAPDAKLEKLIAWIDEGGQSPEHVAPLLGPYLGIDTQGRFPPPAQLPRRRKELLFEILAERMIKASAVQPVLFVVEDAHWSDPTSLELLNLQIARARGCPILILVTFRPEFTAPWVGEPNATFIALRRLDSAQTLMLAADVTGEASLSSELLDWIADHADGVPLFIEELTRAIVESGRSGTGRGTEKPIPGDMVPATLQDALEARLDRLGPAKEIAQLGAVIGRTFDHELLSKLTPVAEEALTHLLRSGLVSASGIPPNATYTFRHALIQDTAYGSLLRSRRAAIHDRIARALERDRPDLVATQPELLAHHFTEGRIVDRAVQYWLAAGKSSLQRSAVSEALAHLREGLGLLDRQVDRSMLREQEIGLWVALASTLRQASGPGHVEVEQAYANAYALCRDSSSPTERFPILYGLFHARYVQGNMKAAHADGEELLRLAGSDRDRAVVAYAALCEYQLFSGSSLKALDYGNRAVELYDIETHPRLAVTYGRDFGIVIYATTAIAQVGLGYPDRAKQSIRNLIAHGQSLDNPYAVVFSRAAAAIPSILLRDIPATVGYARDGLQPATEQGFAGLQALCSVALGWARAKGNPSARALSELRHRMEKARATGNEWIRPLFACLLGEIQLDLGLAGDTLELMEQVKSKIDAGGTRQFESLVLTTKGDAFLALGEPAEAEAERCYLEAIDVARGQSARFWELRAAIRLARLWQAQRKITAARELLVPVHGWFTEGLDTTDLKEATALLDELSRALA